VAALTAVQEAHAQAIEALQREAEALRRADAATMSAVRAELDTARSDLAAEWDHSRAANEAVIAERDRAASIEVRATKAEAAADAMTALMDRTARETDALQDSHMSEVEALNLANAALIEGLDRRLTAVTARANTAEEALEEIRDAEAARRALPLIPRMLAAAFRR
jgi:hypothetical protein